MDNFSESGSYGGRWIDKDCPYCGAQLMANEQNDEWCSSADCEFISFFSDPDTILVAGEKPENPING